MVDTAYLVEDGEILLEVSFWRSARVDLDARDGEEGDRRITCAKRKDDLSQDHCTNTAVKGDDGDIRVPLEVLDKGCFWLEDEERDCSLLWEAEHEVKGVEEDAPF